MFYTFRPVLAAVLVAMLLATSSLPAADSPATDAKASETKAQRDARMKWWREARFGMFIHWGLYSVPAGTYHGKRIGGIGEWIMNQGEIPVAEYAGYAKQFNPVKFNADEWVSIAKNAGMKYIVITSKHHDGFAMFHSKASPYNIVDATPFGAIRSRSLPRPARSRASSSASIIRRPRTGITPAVSPTPTNGRKQGHWDKAQDGDFHQYIREIAIPQVREILTNYGDVAVLWWDTPAGMNREEVHELASLLKLQPQIIANNRLGNGIEGDTETPGAVHSRHRLPRPRLGNVHDDERHLGLQVLRPQLEVDRDAAPQPDRHRQQGRQLPLERRPDQRGPHSAGQRRAACNRSASGSSSTARRSTARRPDRSSAACPGAGRPRRAKRSTCTSSTGPRTANFSCRWRTGP